MLASTFRFLLVEAPELAGAALSSLMAHSAGALTPAATLVAAPSSSLTASSFLTAASCLTAGVTGGMLASVSVFSNSCGVGT